MKVSIFSLLFALVLMSCEKEKESECTKCSSAIQHMADKIGQNNCNPNWMENAVNRIKEDCPSRDIYIVGYLAEDCSFGYQGNLACTDIAYGVQLYDNAKRPIRVRFKNGTPDDTIKIMLTDFRWGFVGADEQTLTLGQTAVMEYTGYKDFGAQVRIGAYNVSTNDTVARAEQEIRYHRTNEWNLMREIEINYNPNTSQYNLDFVYW